MDYHYLCFGISLGQYKYLENEKVAQVTKSNLKYALKNSHIPACKPPVATLLPCYTDLVPYTVTPLYIDLSHYGKLQPLLWEGDGFAVVLSS